MYCTALYGGNQFHSVTSPNVQATAATVVLCVTLPVLNNAVDFFSAFYWYTV